MQCFFPFRSFFDHHCKLTSCSGGQFPGGQKRWRGTIKGRGFDRQGVDVRPGAGGAGIASLRGHPRMEILRGGEQRAPRGPAASVHPEN